MCILRYPAKKPMKNVNENENENVIDISSTCNEVPKKPQRIEKNWKIESRSVFELGPHYLHCLCQWHFHSHSHSHSHFSLVFEMDTSVYTLLILFDILCEFLRSVLTYFTQPFRSKKKLNFELQYMRLCFH